jgi:hypothetical protein
LAIRTQAELLAGGRAFRFASLLKGQSDADSKFAASRRKIDTSGVDFSLRARQGLETIGGDRGRSSGGTGSAKLGKMAT